MICLLKFSQYFLIFAMACLLLTGCCWDPSVSGDAPPCPGKRWFARTIPVIDVLEDDIDQVCGDDPWNIGDLIDIALRKNPTTRQAWANARAAAFNWEASKSTLYPAVTLEEELLLTRSINRASDPIVTNLTQSQMNTLQSLSPGGSIVGISTGSAGGITHNEWMISNLSFTYLLLDFGGRSASIENARQALLSANWTNNRTIQTVIIGVLNSYYNYEYAKALFDSRKDDLISAEEIFRAADRQFQAGVNNKVDVLQALSTLANAQFMLEQQRGAVSIAFGQLAQSLGLPANKEFAVVDLPKELPTEKISENVDELVEMAKEMRPDLAAAQANFLGSQANVIAAWSAGMPTLNVDGQMQQTTNIHHPLLTSKFFSGALFLNVPIFNGFLYVNQTKSAREQAQSAFAAMQVLESQVLLDVVTSYYNFETAVESLQYALDYLKYTEEAFYASLSNYKAGVNTIVDLLTAQSNLADARAKLVLAKTQWVTSLANVAYSTGSL